MNLLLEIFNNLILNESVSTNSITDSIKNKYRVTINYEGDPAHGIAPGLRTIEVYTYGLTKAGNPVIRAYQPYGDTASTVPNWKFFRLDRITSWKPTYSLITRPAPGFNPKGDKSMSVVYSIINFSETPNTSNITGPKQSPKVVGQLDNIEKILADRQKDKDISKQQQNTINTPKNIIDKKNNIQEPDVKGVTDVKQQTIHEPEIQGVEQQPEQTPDEVTQKDVENNIFKPNGEIDQLEKIKDLNRRLDQARKIDLSTIPKR